ncbi:MAG TPA: hypothetical protein VLK84_12925 [Longimicrobium sp.]|nr:hypothetical protein [Longimicrobium sp.]
MRRTCPPVPRRSLVLLLGLLAACGEDEPATIARPHELRLTIIRGAGMRVPVRPVGMPPGEVSLSDDPVIVEISSLIGASVQARAGATGPALEVRMPPVELRWRSLQRWCEPLHATTTLTRGDTVHNYYRRGTLADGCQMVVEGVSEGYVFDADTAFVKFDVGPLVTIFIPDQERLLIGEPIPKRGFVGDGVDAYGNVEPQPNVTVRLTEGGAVFAEADTTITATGEGVGAVMVTSGAFTKRVELWGLPDLRKNGWRLTWGCNDVARPGGARADSIRFVMDSAAALHGGGGVRGQTHSFRGRTIVREWRPGESVRVADLSGFTVIGSMRPMLMEWTPGEASQRTATGYAGGSLCVQTVFEPSGGFVPVRVERR